MEKYILDIDKTRRENNIIIDLPIGEDFSSNINQESLLSNYVDKIKEEKINNIVNYEKYLFYPVSLKQPSHSKTRISFNFNPVTYSYFDANGLLSITRKTPGAPIRRLTNLDDYLFDINKIKFNIHLREREKDSDGNYNMWEVKENAFWNIWDGTFFEDNTKKITIGNKNILGCGDLLGKLGFTDEDVKYQKNSLKKSFLRISIYDTPYRQNQKLLYYSTLFFDTNELYKKYTDLSLTVDNDLVNFDGARYNQSGQILVSGENLLTATFTCASKNNTEACSDGFYLYLFNSLIKENKPLQLYMKIEFNHAKYGKTIPLVLPKYAYEETEDAVLHYENDVIHFTSEDFPLDYETDGELTNGNTYIDIKKLNRDLYTPIFIRYNTLTKHFEWGVLRQIYKTNQESEQSDVFEFTLFEPIINRLKETEENTTI